MYSVSTGIVGPRYSRSMGIVVSKEPAHRLSVVRRSFSPPLHGRWPGDDHGEILLPYARS